jgi:hypothetical protein
MHKRLLRTKTLPLLGIPPSGRIDLLVYEDTLAPAEVFLD